MTFSLPPRVWTTIAPMWPSGAGTTAKSSGLTGAGGLEAHAAASSAAAARTGSLKGPARLLLVDLDEEFRAAHAHDRRRGADLHRLGRLLDHLARHRGKAALPEVALEFALVGGAVEAVLVDREHAVRADGDEAVVGE